MEIVNINKSAYYYNLSMPIENYIEYRKWVGIYSILGGEKSDLDKAEFLLKVFKLGKNKAKEAVQEQNIIALKYLIDNGVKPLKMALICLMKDCKSFYDSDLMEIASKYKINSTFLTKTITFIGENIQNELINREFEKGEFIDGRYRTIEERMSFNRLCNQINKMIDKNDFDMESFYKILAGEYKVYNAISFERDMPNKMHKSLGILRQKADIKTAFDYYTQLNITNEIAKAQKESKNDTKFVRGII